MARLPVCSSHLGHLPPSRAPALPARNRGADPVVVHRHGTPSTLERAAGVADRIALGHLTRVERPVTHSILPIPERFAHAALSFPPGSLRDRFPVPPPTGDPAPRRPRFPARSSPERRSNFSEHDLADEELEETVAALRRFLTLWSAHRKRPPFQNGTPRWPRDRRATASRQSAASRASRRSDARA